MNLNLKPLIAFCVCLVSAQLMSSTSLATAPQQTPAADSKERARLEELFIWKTSEELKLQPSDELKFTEVIHDLNKRRRDANVRMDNALTALNAAKTKPEFEKALSAHRAALRETQALQTTELDRLRPLLGSEKLAKYILAKSSILEKLKSMLASPGAMPAPASAAAPTSTSNTASAAPSGSGSGATAPGTTSATTIPSGSAHASPAAKAK